MKNKLQRRKYIIGIILVGLLCFAFTKCVYIENTSFPVGGMPIPSTSTSMRYPAWYILPPFIIEAVFFMIDRNWASIITIWDSIINAIVISFFPWLINYEQTLYNISGFPRKDASFNLLGYVVVILAWAHVVSVICYMELKFRERRLLAEAQQQD